MSGSPDILQLNGILLEHPAATIESAIWASGNALVNLGAVSKQYVEQMITRERQFSTYLGGGIAIPHALEEARNFIRFEQISIVRLTNEISWGSGSVKLVMGLALSGTYHIETLGSLADLLTNSDQRRNLFECGSPREMLDLLGPLLNLSAHK